MSPRTVRSYRLRNTAMDLNRPPPVTIDLDSLDDVDDDVLLSSPTTFAQAKTNSRRNRRRIIVDVDLEDRTGVTNNISNRRRRGSANQTIINCDHYVNLEDSSSSTKENARKSSETPKDPVFNCPICIGPLIEPVSTKCGHIFCNKCIRAAITVQAKCPTCRKKITVRELIRVFLPSTS
ncbi:PREDICTED: E3 ubiquitin-protein ligase RNF4-like isoform X2 [Lupinus angustifolius]|uniref:E3 ubiquitin-protein ligase RNF4-like isoform X2 n=1 Tax=Lupinus angustifolius TaxID=3871 RepID=UPI00092F40CE|nr:PREDICTED: E3 ubiquitin-protein ligase RNF4-like isoform X2 [Lupinus angustifolius]